MALLAYEEAAGHFETALQALEVKDQPDEAKRCELLLALGGARNSAGDRERAKDACQRAADLARSLGDPKRLAGAALGFAGLWGEYGTVDEVVIGLLEEAVDVLGEEDSALRAMLLARLGGELWFARLPERAEPPSRLAVEVARRVGDPTTLAYALYVRHWAIFGPGNVDERLALGSEIVGLAEEAEDRARAALGHSLRIVALLELADIPAADAEIEAYARVAEELRQPRYLAWIDVWRAMRATLEGRFEEGERLAQEALAMAQRAQEPVAVQQFPIQMVYLCLERGRLQEAEVIARETAEKYPEVAGWRSFLALVYCELGREAEARDHFELAAANDFADEAREPNWLMLAGTLCEIAAVLDDAERAATLYDLLLPYAGHSLVDIGAASFRGATSRYLGLLAATMQRWEDAAQHFEDALEMNARMGARPWVAHTQHDYADMLLRRGAKGDREKALGLATETLDTAQELGMKALVEKALALKLKAQGIASADIKTSIDAILESVHDEAPDLRPHAAPDGTVTIMFSDIEGSTALAERLGDRRFIELLREHNAIVREQVKAHGGFEVKSQGDGFMLAFQSARRALQCAIDIQRGFAERNRSTRPESASLPAHPVAKGDSPGREPASLPAHPEPVEGRAEPTPPAHPSRTSGRAGGDVDAEPIRIRIGLHTGEAIKEGDDFFGKHVNLAARVAGQAQGGEILVSSLLKELTESAGEFAFGKGREVELKGLAGTHRVFGVEWD
ncbi:MAG TPA: adenylate/guanylate cyclase domain-containing protein, partial [Dehalococcoidia bacterium]|nr:adenylate/guanylate cyclase domain-containing protein [Dehalococcoidia bacterium]